MTQMTEAQIRYYDIVIEKPGQPAEHFWTGYPEPFYAYGAIASVGRIVRESAGFGTPVAYADPDNPITNYGDHMAARIDLVRDGAPYATISIRAERVKRPDVGSWTDPGQCLTARLPTDPEVSEEALSQYHVIEGYHGHDTASMACGLVFPVGHCWQVTPRVKSYRCPACLILRRGDGWADKHGD